MKNPSGVKHFASLTIFFSAACLLTISCAGKSSVTAVKGSFQNLVYGKLVAKDSHQPIAGATVYLPKSVPDEKKPLADLSLNSAIRSMGCEAPKEPYASFACSDPSGNFTLSLLSADIEHFNLKIQHNGTTVQTQLSLNDLDSNLGTIVFEATAAGESDSQKKKIAIVLDMQGQAPMSNSSGAINSGAMKVEFEQQFSEMYNIDENEFDVEFLPFPSLFEDKDADKRMDIFNYKIIYLITPGDDDLSRISRENRLTLLDYISKGGELFVTSLNVEATEASLEDYI